MSGKFDISLYDEDFFLWHLTHVRASSMRCMDWYLDKYNPQCVVDFGAGIGSYLEAASVRGIFCRGYEISYAARAHTPLHTRKHIRYRDCTKKMTIGQFDCVLSFETAEHIEPSGTDQFILNLVNATGKRLLFTAAPPGQEGTGHINCRQKQFWIDEFSKHLTYNKDLSDEIAAIWGLQGAPWYIVNNLIVFER